MYVKVAQEDFDRMHARDLWRHHATAIKKMDATLPELGKALADRPAPLRGGIGAHEPDDGQQRHQPAAQPDRPRDLVRPRREQRARSPHSIRRACSAVTTRASSATLTTTERQPTHSGTKSGMNSGRRSSVLRVSYAAMRRMIASVRSAGAPSGAQVRLDVRLDHRVAHVQQRAQLLPARRAAAQMPLKLRACAWLSRSSR